MLLWGGAPRHLQGQAPQAGQAPRPGQGTQPPQETQPAAPIVRVAPPRAVRPRPVSPVRIAPDGTVIQRPVPQANSGGSTTPRAHPPTPPASGTAVPIVHRAPSPSPAAGSPAPSAKPSVAGAATITTPKPAATAPKAATTPRLSTTGLNRYIVVLDPSHGGPDGGARIADNTLEKNVTLAFAFRLRSLLVARGFTVVMTRDGDLTAQPDAPPLSLTLDDRAGIANHARAAACLLVHATGRGMGVHLYNSELAPAPAEAALLPWLTAQAAWVPASQALEGQISAALGRSHIQQVSSTASVRPVDSLTCPALVLELAPEDETPNSINDAGYQSRVAAAVAGALVVWENAVQPPIKIPAAPYVPHLKKREDSTADAPAAEVRP